MTHRWFVVGGVAVFVTLVIVTAGVAAQEFSIFGDFDADTPDSPPATGGAGQPTGIINGGVLVRGSANGISSQPLEAADNTCSSAPFTSAGSTTTCRWR